ncbi:SGNH/GDSL hydrolase family protein [Carnobacterium viridans]|uniref:Lysophospholipase L1 n=1 Tax=Carnobacterium viridans TaxID=174587 RepID=A0A1H0Z589_9LACT|nr:SGNH/GDSL hydrolase family protein [Carnobacterium viridans]UDE94788.1 SGNH/GDSL hydrolase family protein [Carnobacterium viridans]SDQ22615.1 Lysophospholipase L1 [Carnobacterium viridans]
MKLNFKDSILFIGDSVTDVGRDRTNAVDLGQGYPLMIATALKERYAELELSFSNRGIGGDKLKDMAARWEADCLSLNPTVVSILIGINDTWHAVGQDQFGSQEDLQQFEQLYRTLLTTLVENSVRQIILMEPFVLPYPINREMWRSDLDPRIQVVRKLAYEFQADLIPLDGLLNAIGIKQGVALLTGEDGVHPTQKGHELIAKMWLDAVEKEC